MEKDARLEVIDAEGSTPKLICHKATFAASA
jgi:hypothetical protein